MRTSLSLALVGVMVLTAAVGPVAAAGAPTPSDRANAASAPGDSLPSAQGATGASADPAAANASGDAAGDSGGSSDAAGDSSAAQTGDYCEAVAGDEQREDPGDDRLGWENGCWHNDTIEVTRSDGLNETELDAVVARAMARVEEIRGLEFDRSVPVEVISREQFSEETRARFENVSQADSLHQNTKYEALFMVGENDDAMAALERTTAGNVLGYYDTEGDRIVLVSDNVTQPKIDGYTLGHELVHALQWGEWNVSGWNRTTTELNNARNGITEGDANYVEYQYRDRCSAEWECLEPRRGNASGNPHLGMALLQYQPYSDGPVFVDAVREGDNWSAVNAVYENPPASTEQTIHPEKYGEDAPANVTVADRSSEAWNVLEIEDGVDYAEFGEAGLYMMLWYQSYASEGAREVIPRSDVARTTGEDDVYNYDHEYTAGWDGDRLYPYVSNDSAETNETGYVWKTVWDSEDDAREFATAYETLLAEFDAEAVDGRADTYRIEGSDGFDDAFYVNRSGANVTVVNAPTVADLSEVRAGAAPEAPPTEETNGTETASEGANGTDAATETADGTDTATDGQVGTDAEGATETETPDSDAGTANATAAPDGESAETTAAETTTESTATATVSGNGAGFGAASMVAAVAAALTALFVRRR